MNRYVRTPDAVSYNEVVNSQYKLSSSLFLKLVMPNANSKKLADFLSRKLNRTDLGVEVGSLSYIDKSPKYFLRTKALQDYSYIPELTSETMLPILPKDFVNMHLRKGDVVISKDSNIGEVVILEKDYPDCMLSGALYKLPLKEEWKYYLLAFIKHDIFREQLNAIVPKGATIRHAKTLFLDCVIPLPNNNAENVIKYVSILTEAIINKQVLIKQRHAEILRLIDEELYNNQKEATFTYQLPTLKDLQEVGRLDTGLYSSVFKESINLIHSYSGGYKNNIYALGYKLNRGQNLQESNIGKSIYSDKSHDHFYTLALPTYFSEYGTINKTIYLGNPNKLKTLSQGEIVFGAEATFRGFVVCDKKDKCITNIHGITISNNGNLIQSIFVKSFLDYLVRRGVIDAVKVGGHGGSFAQKYWDIIPFPNFPESKQKEIAALYHNPQEYQSSDCTLANFLVYDDSYNSTAGIYELDKTAKHFQQLLSQAIDDIVNDREVVIRL
ncbi:MAG: hypothetical protein IJT12_01440 [Paludibacteraceae bacterium]|nr:hypothetical protein [Paludibacteraceae bacterium]